MPAQLLVGCFLLFTYNVSLDRELFSHKRDLKCLEPHITSLGTTVDTLNVFGAVFLFLFWMSPSPLTKASLLPLGLGLSSPASQQPCCPRIIPLEIKTI